MEVLADTGDPELAFGRGKRDPNHITMDNIHEHL